ncbi:cobalt transporter CbiM [Fusobacteria bacterium ZRK30]|nr:cobalt transporter CbiM [Fusobacteria bacterium ZRK30]
MHIPDNYLSPSTCAVLFGIMIPVWRRATKKVKEQISSKKMPLVGICASFSFLIMMFNVPLPGGTTGHAVGATLVAILLGPHAAVLAITIALAIQALFFGDGGILALGANCFNMAFIMPFTGYYIYKFIMNKTNFKQKELIATFAAGYISLNISAFFTAFQFGIQPYMFRDAVGLPLYNPYGLDIALPAILIPHLLLAGIIEGIVTSSVYSYIKKVSPEIIYKGNEFSIKLLYILIGSMALITPIGLIATGTAWGEWGAKELGEIVGFIPKGFKSGFNFESMMPDYAIAGLGEMFGYILSAITGITLIFVLTKLLFKKNLK